MEKSILTVEELLIINENMLGRGAPNQDDGIGYNKADFGACSNYYFGLSDAQVADLAKRLVKYSKTQLHLDKEMMKDTAEYYKSLVKNGSDRENGISIDVMENETLIGFKYNEEFVAVIKSLPKRRFDIQNKQWVIPNDKVITALNELSAVGADVENALAYASNHEFIKNAKTVETKTEVLMKDKGDWVLLKFNYNKKILDTIKETIDIKERQWNPDFKFWAIKKCHFENLKSSLNSVANFKAM